jgi:hypothetical protein
MKASTSAVLNFIALALLLIALPLAAYASGFSGGAHGERGGSTVAVAVNVQRESVRIADSYVGRVAP